MKKILFIAAFLPAALIAQNITNTLGASGSFVVENSTNADVLLINPTGPLLVLGNQPAPFATSILPAGQFNFISSAASGVLNLISSNAGNRSRLNLMYANGNLTTGGVLAIVNGDVLGTIGFGGAITNAPAWNNTGATITGVATSNVVSGNYATKIDVTTSNGSGGSNTMTFNSEGNLIVPASVTSQAITTKAASYAATLNDQTILCTAALTVTLPAASGLAGKVFTIKQNVAGPVVITIASAGGLIDDNASIAIGSTSDSEFVTLQSDGTNWFVIGQGNGF